MNQIAGNISIDPNDLVFKSSRSSGPGGQNVNKLNTRVTLLFDVANSRSLSEQQRELVFAELGSRVDKSGVVRVVSQKFRTQKANRAAALDKLRILLAKALTPRKVRKRTSVPFAARLRRLQDKRQRSLLKQQRTAPNTTEDR